MSWNCVYSQLSKLIVILPIPQSLPQYRKWHLKKLVEFRLCWLSGMGATWTYFQCKLFSECQVGIVFPVASVQWAELEVIVLQSHSLYLSTQNGVWCATGGGLTVIPIFFLHLPLGVCCFVFVHGSDQTNQQNGYFRFTCWAPGKLSLQMELWLPIADCRWSIWSLLHYSIVPVAPLCPWVSRCSSAIGLSFLTFWDLSSVLQPGYRFCISLNLYPSYTAMVLSQIFLSIRLSL